MSFKGLYLTFKMYFPFLSILIEFLRLTKTNSQTILFILRERHNNCVRITGQPHNNFTEHDHSVSLLYRTIHYEPSISYCGQQAEDRTKSFSRSPSSDHFLPLVVGSTLIYCAFRTLVETSPILSTLGTSIIPYTI